MKNICIVSHHPFWAEPLGCGALMRGRYDLISKLADSVFVVYITRSNTKCPLNGLTIKVGDQFGNKELETFKNFLIENNISICYFSYDQFQFLTPFTGCKNILELNDVMHIRQQKFAEYGYTAPYIKQKKEELDSMSSYDMVFCLNINEVQYLKENNVNNVYYLPPMQTYLGDSVSSDVEGFGLIGSQALPNIDGFQLLNKDIAQSSRFVLAGPLCYHEKVKEQSTASVNYLGVINDPRNFYEQIDVALSPIRFGGGLKIKVFEALSFGKPVVATEHSIEGFPQGIREIVHVVDDISSWRIDDIDRARKIDRTQIKKYFLEYFQSAQYSEVFKKMLA